MTRIPKEDGAAVRAFIRGHGAGALASVDPDQGGAPSNALVTYACSLDASPIFLFSTLSGHTRNLLKDRRAALLIEAAKRHRKPGPGQRFAAGYQGYPGMNGARRPNGFLRDIRMLNCMPVSLISTAIG